MKDWMPHFIPVSTALWGEPALACPVCGDEYVHPIGLECVSPGHEHGRVYVDHHGVHMDPTHGRYGRGVVITLRLTCESGHKFDYEFQFHKGSTRVRRSMSAQVKGPIEPTIWRD